MAFEVGEVFVAGVFGDEAADADLTEVVDPASEFVDGAVEGVGMLVEEGEEEFLTAIAVAPFAALGGVAGLGVAELDVLGDVAGGESDGAGTPSEADTGIGVDGGDRPVVAVLHHQSLAGAQGSVVAAGH